METGVGNREIHVQLYVYIVVTVFVHFDNIRCKIILLFTVDSISDLLTICKVCTQNECTGQIDM